jgi:two-component system, OmpR family, response regulator VicR
MKKKASLLYVEDDETLSFVTRDNLELRGYEVEHCMDGLIALEKLAIRPYDICILDVMLPKMDGFTLARRIREKNDHIPIIFLTAKSTKEDKIHGLQLGADDYITKPYSIEELVLKIEVFLKRTRIYQPEISKPDIYSIGKFIFDPVNQQLTEGEKRTTLTYKEAELLQILAENPNVIIKREILLMKVWGNDHFFSSRSLDVFISRLRKILSPDIMVKIDNIHNVGYRLTISGPNPG